MNQIFKPEKLEETMGEFYNILKVGKAFKIYDIGLLENKLINLTLKHENCMHTKTPLTTLNKKWENFVTFFLQRSNFLNLKKLLQNNIQRPRIKLEKKAKDIYIQFIRKQIQVTLREIKIYINPQL